MKKFYLLCFVLFCGVSQQAFSQVHTAIFTGNWSDVSIWGANGQPSNPCNNCTITINDGVAVTLDISFKMTGTSKLFIGSAGAFASSLTIPATNSGSVATGHNITLSNVANANPTIKIVSALSSLTFTQGPGTTGKYDGVFVQSVSDNTYFKIVGLRPSLISSDGITIPSFEPFIPAPIYGTSLPNGAHPAPFTLNADGTLPVILSSFDAQLNKDRVDITWSTSMELNSDFFAVQRSNDAVKWETIGKVNANTNSGAEINYSFTDASPVDGKVNYYRLQIVDRNGQYKYSIVKAVSGSATTGFRIFPNPAKEFVNITVGSDQSSELTFRLFNQSGQVMQERKLSNAAGTIVTLPVHGYPQGSYILSVSDNAGKKQVSKVLIAR